MKDWLIQESGILFRASLYFLAAFLPTFYEQIKDIADGTQPTPGAWKIVAILTAALIPAVIATRAYFDGSVQRHKDSLPPQNGKPPTP